jgi:tetratricopeptide (TPR) repeat protein
MKGYATREVADLLGLSRDQVRSYVRSRFLDPVRGPRGAYRFSFQDLVFLRTAKGLLAARVGPRRVRRVLARLREQLPEGRRLAGLHITAEGGRIVVDDGSARWQPESGQILFDFDIAEIAKKAAPVVRHAFRRAREEAGGGFGAEDWYQWGCELEPSSAGEAREAYRKALELEPAHADAHVNLGRLLQEAGDARAAEIHYRCALDARPQDPTAAFDLGVALEDLGRAQEAVEAYERVVRIDPGYEDAHYNAARLYERIGDSAAVVRHLKAYRKLIRGHSH